MGEIQPRGEFGQRGLRGGKLGLVGDDFQLGVGADAVDFVERGLAFELEDLLIVTSSVLPELLSKPVLLDPVLLTLVLNDLSSKVLWSPER